MNELDQELSLGVVIPVYNDPVERLETTLASVRDVFRFANVVVVDDGSDAEFNYCKAAFNHGCRYLRHEKNKGPSYALNTGIDYLHQPYIARIDVGDTWIPDAKKRQLAFVLANKAKACFSLSINGIDEQPYPYDHDWHKRIYRNNQFQASSIIFDRETWIQIPFDNSLKYADDWHWAMQVHFHIGWTPYPEVTGYATQWPGGHSDPTDPEMLKLRDADRTRVAREALRLLTLSREPKRKEPKRRAK